MSIPGPAHSEHGVDSEHNQSITENTIDNDNNLNAGCENSPIEDNPLSHPVPPSGQQSTLSFSQAGTAHPNFTFTFPFSSNSQSAGPGQNLKGGRCSVCIKALCPRRHECNGSVNRAWCRHGHPPLGANEKIRWSEAEVERRIASGSR